MLTKDDLEQLSKLMDQKIEPLKQQLEAVHEFNKKAHAEIMDLLNESNEINGKEIKKLDKRVTAIETELHIPKN